MNSDQKYTSPWKADLAASRDLSRSEKAGFALILDWYEKWRVSQGLPAERESAATFWRLKVMGRKREPWQLDQWAQAFRWLLKWLRHAKSDGETRSLEERVRDAVDRAGSRRGLARRTRQTYAGWAGRFCRWARDGRKVMNPAKLG